MRRLRSLLLAVPLVWAAPDLASAQDLDYRGERVPWSEQGEVASAARQIADRATQLARHMRRFEGYSPLTDEAQRFARTAQIFERSVRSGAPYPQLMSSFDVLQREYYEMRDAFFRAHRAHHIEELVREWTSLVAGFERLALALGVEEERLCELPGRYRYGGRYDDDYDDYDDDYGYYGGRDRYGRYDPRYDARAHVID